MRRMLFSLGLISLTLTVVALGSAGAQAAATSQWSIDRGIYTGTQLGVPMFQMSSAGNGTAVWSERAANGTYQLWAIDYAPAVGWSARQLLFQGNASIGSLQFKDLAMDDAGRAAALFTNESYDEVNATYAMEWWVVRYQPGTGWGASELTWTDDNDNPASVAIGAGGEVYIFRGYLNGTEGGLLVQHYAQGTGWQDAKVLVVDAPDAFPFLLDGPSALAADSTGLAVATWTIFNDTGYAIEAWGAASGTSGWTTFRLDDGGSAGASAAVAAAGGVGYFLYNEYPTAGTTQSVRRFTPMTGLAAAEPIAAGPGSASGGHLAADTRGNVTVAWLDNAGGTRAVWGAYYSAREGWWQPSVQLDLGGGNATAPLVATDGRGGAFVAWAQPQAGNGTVYVARYAALGGWVPTTNLNGPFGQMRVGGIGSSGDEAIALWLRTSGSARAIEWAPFVRDNVPPAFEAYGPAALVNQETVIASGSVEPGGFVFVDGVAATVEGGGAWYIVVSVPGDYAHTLVIEAYDADGNGVRSTRTVTVDTFCDLMVLSPADGFSTNFSVLFITGTIEDGSEVRANDLAVVIDTVGRFTGQVPLVGGLNLVTVTGRDPAGNLAAVTLNVTFNDPVAPIAAALANATAQLAALQAQVNASGGGSAEVMEALNATNASLAEARAALEAERANGTVDAGRIASLEAQIGSLVTSITAAQQGASASQAAADSARQEVAAAQSLALVALVAAIAAAAVAALALLRPRRTDGPKPPPSN